MEQLESYIASVWKKFHISSFQYHAVMSVTFRLDDVYIHMAGTTIIVQFQVAHILYIVLLANNSNIKLNKMLCQIVSPLLAFATYST
jgi:hypothetical protein